MSSVLFNSGTVYLNSGHLLASDISTFVGLSDLEPGQELLFDRRTGVWSLTDVFRFVAHYSDGSEVTVRVNTEFASQQAAREQALYYAEAAGRAPGVLREDLSTISIHMGDEDYGGGSGDLLIHTGRTPEFLALGSLDEVLIHELVHITLDSRFSMHPGWLAAQVLDNAFVSDYAQTHPSREDLAETFLLYYVLQEHPERMTPQEIATLVAGIPARMGFLNGLGLDLSNTIETYSAMGLASDNADYLIASNGGDTVDGMQGNDTLQGGDGADSLLGGSQEDRLYGDGGHDTLRGGAGFDSLYGGNGHDLMDGGAQADNLFGGIGDDTMLGGSGFDRLFGQDGNDVLFGGDTFDSLFGQENDDRLFGQNGNDNMLGGQGNDILDGGGDDDRMIGGAGFDTLLGSTGNDTMTGAFNADVFVFNDFGGGFGQDVITDFDANNNFERIDLSGVASITDFSDLVANHMTQVGANVVINDGNGNTITLQNVDLNDLMDNNDFIF